MRLRGQTVIQGMHRLGEQLLHGRHNLRRRGDVRQFGGVFVEPRFNLGKSICGSCLLRGNTSLQAGDGLLDIARRGGICPSAPLTAGISERARGDSRQEDGHAGDEIERS